MEPSGFNKRVVAAGSGNEETSKEVKVFNATLKGRKMELEPHTATSTSSVWNLVKLINRFYLWCRQTIASDPDPILGSLKRSNHLVSNIDLKAFQGYLAETYRKDGKKPQDAPHPNIANMQESGLKPYNKAEGTIKDHFASKNPVAILTPELKNAEKHNQRLIAYPFVFPSKGILHYDHIVLIVVDRQTKTVHYYDPQGLSSDDPDRQYEGSEFNMHESLKQVAAELGPGAKVVEHTDRHQYDPFNCGAFIMLAMKSLYENMITNNQDLEAVNNALTAGADIGVRKIPEMRTGLRTGYMEYYKAKWNIT